MRAFKELEIDGKEYCFSLDINALTELARHYDCGFGQAMEAINNKPDGMITFVKVALKWGERRKARMENREAKKFEFSDEEIGFIATDLIYSGEFEKLTESMEAAGGEPEGKPVKVEE